MNSLLQRYTAGMARYVATAAEAPLLDIEELGRLAITDDISLDEIAGLHEGAALALTDQGVPINEPEIIRRMSACLSALMVSAAVAYRTKIDLLEQHRQEERDRTERDRQRLETLGQFVGSVAHELNNLLQPVRGMTEIMVADLAEQRPPERADLEVIEGCAIQAVSVIQGILGYVRRETIAPQRLAFGAAVATACTFIRPMLREPFEVAIRDRDSEVLARQGELTQILLNLLQNAVQAGATHIRVEVDRIGGDWRGGGQPPRMRLRVTDNGQGMSAAVAARALDPYFTTKASGQGTGLGLAIVRSIVLGWSGDLELESEPERGTTLTLLLPVAIG
ncbi:sensor histidine kinase [Methylobacterium pseudosasicola]|uniref:histidine kinase n=1 Tax=Methylobacterium pseudosasicola TaxID=582667 RepID=A0A1I4L9E3_9HYPH|nr:ATP-binding protein [Methylobacterium pseudosasicola]SFL87655.1 His Kinase A (phospho-acceptor) domain-containing protein [Methylobacterium pseudosasicola]